MTPGFTMFGCEPRFGMPRQKLFNLQLVFFPENRTGHVKQFTTASGHLPQGIEQPLLLFHKSGNIFVSAQPLYVRVAPYYTRGSAGRIQQNTLHRYAIPPGCDICRIDARQTRLKSEALQILLHSAQTYGIVIKRRHLDISKFHDMAGFASGSSTSVYNVLSGADVEQIGRKLGACVLDRHQALFKSGQGLDGYGLIKSYGLDRSAGQAQELSSKTILVQQHKILLRVALAPVYPQRHWWMEVSSPQNLVSLVSQLLSQFFYPPSRVGVTRDVIGFGCGQQLLTLA